MTNATIARAAVLAVLLVTGCQPSEEESAAGATPESVPAAGDVEEAPGFLYGRVTTYRSGTYEGRLRWGGGEEAFWSDYFNGVKDENPWGAYAPAEQLTEARDPIKVFGLEISRGERQMDLDRPFMARFGDIARIEARGAGVQNALQSGTEYDPDVRVTLKSGTAFELDRNSAGDFDDGVRVWDESRGVVDLGPREIRSIEFLPTDSLRGVPARLHGTVQTREGAFTGFLQWDREEATGSDVLTGQTADGERRLRFDAIGSIARDPEGGSRVTLLDGREIALSGNRKVDRGHRGVYVDDPRYGRVLVSWDAFERVDFSPDGSGPSYGDFAPGRDLTGAVLTRDGRRLRGRLVVDLDESETTETLDAPSNGVDYTIPFGSVASIVLPDGEGLVVVTLASGESLELERSGDLGAGNAGMLVFADGDKNPTYVPWADVHEVRFDFPPSAREE